MAAQHASMAAQHASMAARWKVDVSDDRRIRMKDYSDGIVAQLEAAFQADGEGAEVRVHLRGTDYLIFHCAQNGSWKQQRVDDISRWRYVQRVVPKASRTTTPKTLRTTPSAATPTPRKTPRLAVHAESSAAESSTAESSATLKFVDMLPEQGAAGEKAEEDGGSETEGEDEHSTVGRPPTSTLVSPATAPTNNPLEPDSHAPRRAAHASGHDDDGRNATAVEVPAHDGELDDTDSDATREEGFEVDETAEDIDSDTTREDDGVGEEMETAVETQTAVDETEVETEVETSVERGVVGEPGAGALWVD